MPRPLERQTMTHVWLFLKDEYPRIGNGRRRVEIVTEGWKWVVVRYRPGGPKGPTIRQRIRKEIFERLISREAPNPKRS